MSPGRIPSTLFVSLAILALNCGTRKAAGPPFSAEQSIEMMKLADGYKIEKFASEPDVVSPAAMDIDEEGNIYVAEDRGYPLNTEGKIGRIKLLRDTNNDGIPDRTTTFADGLVLPNGVMAWKKGVLVTDAPDVWYMEDTDGDGKADVKKKVLTGFPLTNPQHTVNGAVFGLDNWIYLAHENPTTAIVFADKFGDRGTDIRFVEGAAKSISERGHNTRFRPDTGELEALAGTSQFGHGFDEFGRHFVLNNTYHARHEAIDARYLRRNPDLPIVTAIEDISDHGSPSKVYPIVPKTRFEMLTNVGEFTSACGLTFWRGGVFVAEPAHNLAHRDVYYSSGSGFKAKRDKDGVEFLASKDPWFRPVNFYAGPDGSLFLLDYYRLVIEHPEWMATETYGSKDLTAGIDRGRIYRITPASGFQKTAAPHLRNASTAELVGHLESDNPWWRRTAQRLLMDRKPADAVQPLEKLAQDSKSPVGRVHALWSLDGLGQLKPALIEKALQDSSAGVRENAIKLAELHLTRLPEVPAKLVALKADPDARVRFQLLCTLGSVKGDPARQARDEILKRDMKDRWIQIAALSAGPEEATRLLASADPASTPASFYRQAASVVGVRRRAAEMQSVIARVTAAPAPKGDEDWRASALDGLAAGFRGKPANLPAPVEAQLLAVFDKNDARLRASALHVLQNAGLSQSPAARAAVTKALATAQSANADAAARADAIGLVALSAPETRIDMFEKLAAAGEPEPVRAAAVRALGAAPGEPIGKFIIQNWRGFTPPVRLEAADALYKDPQRIPMVLAALKSGDIQPWTLAFRHRARLVMNRDPAIREAARQVLNSSEAERAKVIAQYQAALEKSAQATRGKNTFDNICIKCHKLNGRGADVGPDLATVRNQPKQVLLAAILNPSQSISQGFESYVVETNGGGMFDGVLGPQTTTTLTLRHEEGKEDVIQRKDIKSMYVTNLSAMPADLEKQITVEQMADLLEYLKTGD